jgi:NCAIR mutase (PurE)-related protein
MDPQALISLLQQVKDSNCSVDQAMQQLANFSLETVRDACVDHHRHLRTGIPEVIYGEAKSARQIIDIAKAMQAKKSPLIATRISAEKANIVRQQLPELDYKKEARLLIGNGRETVADHNRQMTLVICAGTSDIPVAEEARQTLKALGLPVEKLYDAGVAGLHRLLDKRRLLSEASVIIVVAGMEGALPSVVAGLVSCPVIAVPTSVGYGASFGGLAALLGMLNSCAPGVAVVNIDNGFGAACMASAINSHQPRGL